jgi:hypothetical protein
MCARTIAALASGLVLLASSSRADQASSNLDVALTPVAVSGQPIPGGDGARFSRFHLSPPPRIDNSGNVAFFSELSGPSGITALFGGRPGSLSLVARPGDPVPGTALRFGTLSVPRLSVAGEMVVYSEHDLLLWRPGEFLHVAHDGNPVDAPQPQSPFATTVAFTQAVPGDNGLPPTVRLLAGRPAALREVARSGRGAPGPEGSQFYGGFTHAPFSSSGELWVRGGIIYPGAGIQTAIWAGTPDALRLVVSTGVPTPAAGGFTFSGLDEPQINAAGQVAFRSRAGLWVASADGSVLTSAGAPGDPAPGAGGQFTSFHQPSFNDAGQVAFRAEFWRPGDPASTDGIWAGRPGELRLVVHEGQPAPGAGEGVTFANLLSWDPMFNANGQVAFGAVLAGPGVTTASDRALYASDPQGNLHLVAREGMRVELPNGTGRIITALDFPTGASGPHSRSQSFNDAGQLIFAAGFENGSAVLIANVPEPDAWAALAATALCPLLSRRRRR